MIEFETGCYSIDIKILREYISENCSEIDIHHGQIVVRNAYGEYVDLIDSFLRDMGEEPED